MKPCLPLALMLMFSLTACGGAMPDVGGGSGSSGSTTPSGTTGTTTGGTATGANTSGVGTSAAATLAAKLGRPNRLLIGLGGGNETSDILSQALHVDFYDRYLTDNAGGSWVDYVPGAPQGAYIGQVSDAAESIGAIPMFTLYQFAIAGDGNLSVLGNRSQMQTYWQHTVLLFQRLAAYGKPAIVNFEPDFWGYAQNQAPGGDPTRLFAYVNITPECASLPNDVTGVGACLLRIARQYAPKAYVGFPPSEFGMPIASIVAFMNRIGAANADFIVSQTLDRDAGCFEKTPQPTYCARSGSGWYWDETNVSHPNFQDHFANENALHTGIGGLPLLWWQTPMGVPASTPLAGSANRYRDNRVHYFLTRATELTAIGGLGVVFGAGESNQTNIKFDGGQFQNLSNDYLAQPAPLP